MARVAPNEASNMVRRCFAEFGRALLDELTKDTQHQLNRTANMHILFALSALIATSTALPRFLTQIFPPDHLLTWPLSSDSSNDIDIDDDFIIEYTTTTITIHPTVTSTLTLLPATVTTGTATHISTPTIPSTPHVSCMPYSGPPRQLLPPQSPLRQNPSLFSSYALQLAESFCTSAPVDTDFHHRTIPLRIPSTYTDKHPNPNTDSELVPLSSHVTPALLTFTFDGATTTTVHRNRFEVHSRKAAECSVGCVDAMQTLVQECGGFGGSKGEPAIESAVLQEDEGGCGKWGVWVHWLSGEEMRREAEEGSRPSTEEGRGEDAWRVELR